MEASLGPALLDLWKVREEEENLSLISKAIKKKLVKIVFLGFKICIYLYRAIIKVP